MYKISPAAQAKANQIAEGYEGLGGYRDGKYYRYQCKADRNTVWTIGKGHVISLADLASGRFKDGLTLAQVRELYAADMKPRRERLEKLMGRGTDDQAAGLLSMQFNLEEQWGEGMTVAECWKLNDLHGVARGMLLYIKSNGKKRLGLWRRRMSEALCFLTGEVIVAKDPVTEARLEARLRQVLVFPPKPKGLC